MFAGFPSRLEYDRDWRSKNRDKVNAQSRAAYARNPEAHQLVVLRLKLKRLGIDLDCWLPKPTVCLCGRSVKICFDHCHKSNKPRGWLCSKCNSILGMADDNPTTLRRLADYLEQTGVTN